MAAPYEILLRHVESLRRDEQLRLIADLAEHLRNGALPEEPLSILELRGLGKEIWKGLDAQAYVDNERASWNG